MVNEPLRSPVKVNFCSILPPFAAAEATGRAPAVATVAPAAGVAATDVEMALAVPIVDGSIGAEATVGADTFAGTLAEPGAVAGELAVPHPVSNTRAIVVAYWRPVRQRIPNMAEPFCLGSISVAMMPHRCNYWSSASSVAGAQPAGVGQHLGQVPRTRLHVIARLHQCSSGTALPLAPPRTRCSLCHAKHNPAVLSTGTPPLAWAILAECRGVLS